MPTVVEEQNEKNEKNLNVLISKKQTWILVTNDYATFRNVCMASNRIFCN